MEKRKRPVQCWRIRGYDSKTEVFDQVVPIGQITESGIRELLRALAAKNLSPREIVGAYAKRGTEMANNLVEIRTETQVEKHRTLYMCGMNPHYIANTETHEAS